MNTANLQLEGLYLAIAAVNAALVRKGLMTREEIDDALVRAEQVALGDPRTEESLRPAERDALAFPARLLRRANTDAGGDMSANFSELAREVGLTKGSHNDQR
jgi:hypothetical protein